MDQLNIWTRHIGSPLAPTKALFCECTRIARQCSYVLFQTRNLPTWHSRPLMRSIKEEPATASFIKDGTATGNITALNNYCREILLHGKISAVFLRKD